MIVRGVIDLREEASTRGRTAEDEGIPWIRRRIALHVSSFMRTLSWLTFHA